MLRNYFLIAWRNMRRHSSYTIINLVGLSVGIACFLLISLYIRYEFSFDNYHEHKDRIFRVTSLSGFNEKSWGGTTQGDPVPAMLDYAEVESVSRIRSCGDHKIYYQGVWHRDLEMKCAESSFFDIFSLNVIQGNPQTFLDRPATGVITQSFAQRIFGNENPIGKTLPVTVFENEVSIEITGLMEDIPDNTHFKADFIISFETLRQFTRLCLDCGATSVYTRLAEHADVAAINERLTTLIRETLGKERVEAVELEPLGNIHFSERWAQIQGDIRYVYLLSAIALVILLIACANYMNLATARGISRNREIGIRKVVGAMRGQIIRQFLSETLLLTLIAIPIAGLLILTFTPYFNDLAQTNVTFGWHDVNAYAGLVLVVSIGVGLIAGLYPAVFLSRHQPVAILQISKNAGKLGGGFRKVLVGSQFVASIFLILGTTIIISQLRFMQEKKLGFDYDQVLLISLTDSELSQSYATVKQRFSGQAGVRYAAAGNGFPGEQWFGGVRLIDYPFGKEEPALMLTTAAIDEDFLSLMQIPLIAGHNITPVPLGAEQLSGAVEVLVNESAIQALREESPESALGKTLFNGRFEIVGVVPDFNFNSLHKEIEPLMLKQNDRGTASKIALKVAGGQIPPTLTALESAWNQMGTSLPFEYNFLDDEINKMYEQEQRTARVFGIFSALAILIACLGLVGLAMFVAVQRTKEISIRKILGASMVHLIQLLTGDFLKIVSVAFVIAAPVAYFAAGRWLENFAYRIDLSAGPFVLAGAIALLITLATISIQAFRTASANPVQSLRQE